MTDKTTLSKLWRESGQSETFAQFAENFNKKQGNFKNFIAHPVDQAGNADQQQTTKPDYMSNPDPKPLEQAPTVDNSGAIDKKQAILLVALGLAIGSVAVIVYNHVTK